MGKILIACTFREFDGKENDKIQRKFLESLKNQTYKDIELIATTFGEKNVKKTLDSYKLKNKTISGKLNKTFKYSQTQVLLNTIDWAKKSKNIEYILWTTVDIIYPKDFFEIIIKSKFPKKSCLTIHPSDRTNSIFDRKITRGFDMLFFDAQTFISSREDIGNYTNNDWGNIENFLIAIALKNKMNMINLYPSQLIERLENDREQNSQTNEWMLNSWEKNKKELENFIKKNNLSKRILNLGYCHNCFSSKKIILPSIEDIIERIKFEILLLNKFNSI